MLAMGATRHSALLEKWLPGADSTVLKEVQSVLVDRGGSHTELAEALMSKIESEILEQFNRRVALIEGLDEKLAGKIKDALDPKSKVKPKELADWISAAAKGKTI